MPTVPCATCIVYFLGGAFDLLGIGMTIRWYATNPGFHPIPAGYGLPWGTAEEEFIPDSLVQEAEFELARKQLATQTPTGSFVDPNSPAPPTNDIVVSIHGRCPYELRVLFSGHIIRFNQDPAVSYLNRQIDQRDDNADGSDKLPKVLPWNEPWKQITFDLFVDARAIFNAFSTASEPLLV